MDEQIIPLSVNQYMNKIKFVEDNEGLIKDLGCVLALININISSVKYQETFKTISFTVSDESGATADIIINIDKINACPGYNVDYFIKFMVDALLNERRKQK